MKKLIFILPLLLFGLLSCNNETSLQEYYVENQKDNEFVALDISSSLLSGANSSLSPEQQETLKTVEKLNIIAYPKKENTQATFEKEKQKVAKIIENDDYETLMKYGFGETQAQLYFLGKVDAIDELIVFAANDAYGFGVVRVLGNDMKPEDLIKLFRSAKAGDLNLEGLQALQEFFPKRKDSLSK